MEEAERWGVAVFQPIPRRLAWWAIKRERKALRSFAEGAALHVPIGLAIRAARPIIRLEIHTHGATDESVQADLRALPKTLSRIDAWVEGGVIGGATPNAADFQIAPIVRLLMCSDQLRPRVAERPRGRLATRLVPDFPGRIGRLFPRPGYPVKRISRRRSQVQRLVCSAGLFPTASAPAACASGIGGLTGALSGAAQPRVRRARMWGCP